MPAINSERAGTSLVQTLRASGRPGRGRLTPATGGESGTAFWLTERTGQVSLLKLVPATPDAAGHLRAVGPVLARLRDRGYPAPRFRAVG